MSRQDKERSGASFDNPQIRNGTSQEADSHAEPEAQTQELHADLTKKKAVPSGTAFFFVVFL